MTLANDASLGLVAGRNKGVRRLGLAALLALVVGCSSTYREGVDTVKLVLHEHSGVDLTPESVAARPFFQLRAISPDGQAVLILGGVEGNLQTWYGHAGQAVFLEHGVVVRTIGLRQNLDDTRWPSSNPFASGLQTLSSPLDAVRVVDWSPSYRYGVTLNARLATAGMEDVTILGTVHHLRRVDERVSAPAAGFVAVNHYWVDPADGFIWKSHQVVAPGVPLDLIQLRPYQAATP